MKTMTKISIAVPGAALAAVALIAHIAGAAATQAQKCDAAKMSAAGGYARCRMNAEANALKAGVGADFSQCDARLAARVQGIENRYGAACSTQGVSTIVDGLSSATSSLACALGAPARGACIVPSAAQGSILVYESLAVTASADSTVRLGNRSNIFALVHCLYVATDPACTVSDFQLGVPAQSVVTWQASVGAGTIPPLPAIPFYGRLVCVEVDQTDVPLAGNHLVGDVTQAGGQATDATALAGDPNGGNFDNVLDLGGPGHEYDACPASIPVTEIQSCWSLGPFVFQCN